MFGGNSLTDENKYCNVAALITFHHGILCMREIFHYNPTTKKFNILATLNKWSFLKKRADKNSRTFKKIKLKQKN